MKYRVYFFVFFISYFFSFNIWAEDLDSPKMSQEYFMRMLEGEKVFLWKISKSANDELGFKSLRLVDEAEGNLVISEHSDIYGLVFQFNDVSFKLSPFTPCEIISQAAKKIQNILRSKIMCNFDLRASEPYILVIGDNTNEIVREIKTERENYALWHPSWYDYEVNH